MQLVSPNSFDTNPSILNNRDGEHLSPAPKSYDYAFHTTLKHSNATQNIYFSNYIEWQGMVRERWFFECIDDQMLQNQGVFVTKQVHQYYLKEGFPFQTVNCRLNTFNIQRCSFCLLFRFEIDGQLVSSGFQQIAFTNHSKRVTRLPKSVLAKIRAFEVPDPQLPR